MADEKDVKEKVETEKVETKEEAKVDEKPTEKVEEKGTETEKTEKVDEKVDEKGEETEKAPEEPTESSNDESVVEETEPVGNGIRIEDVVTKDYFEERFAALSAKFDAVIKENSDLKEKLSFMEKKYEDSDFGDLTKQGVLARDKDANSTFDEYSKQFM